MKFWRVIFGVVFSLLLGCSAPSEESDNLSAEVHGSESPAVAASAIASWGTVVGTYDDTVAINQADGDGEVIVKTIEVNAEVSNLRILASASLFLDVTAGTRPATRILVNGGPYVNEQISYRVLSEVPAGTMVTMMGRLALPTPDTYHVSLIATTDGWPGATMSSVGIDDTLVVTVLKN